MFCGECESDGWRGGGDDDDDDDETDFNEERASELHSLWVRASRW